MSLVHKHLEVVVKKLTMQIKSLSPNFQIPKKVETGDWIDLATVEDIKYKAGEFILIRLGFAAKLPRNYEAHLLPRSSTYHRYGILHASSGLIDESYCGDTDEWLFACVACRDGEIPMGTRVCQFRIVNKMRAVSFEFVESLGEVSRGGFGSTGR